MTKWRITILCHSRGGNKIQLTLKLSHNEIYATAMILMSSILTQNFYFWKIFCVCLRLKCAALKNPKIRESKHHTRHTSIFNLPLFIIETILYFQLRKKHLNIHTCASFWGWLCEEKKGFWNIFCEICFQLTHKFYHPRNSFFPKRIWLCVCVWECLKNQFYLRLHEWIRWNNIARFSNIVFAIQYWMFAFWFSHFFLHLKFYRAGIFLAKAQFHLNCSPERSFL